MLAPSQSRVAAATVPRTQIKLATGLRPALRVSRLVAAIAPPAQVSVALIAPLARRSELWWWEFESEIKRTLALEILMRKMFAASK
jgi:hypothetical protein